MKVLPENYDFEVKKTVWRLRQANVKTLALQFPDALLAVHAPAAGVCTAKASELVRDAYGLGGCPRDRTCENERSGLILFQALFRFLQQASDSQQRASSA